METLLGSWVAYFGNGTATRTRRAYRRRRLPAVAGACSAAFCVAVTLTSCGPSDSSSRWGAATDFIVARSKTICQKTFECCTAADIAVNSAQTQAECEAMDSGLDTIANTVASGKVTINWELAQSCFATISAMTCDEWAEVLSSGVPAGCKGILAGTVPAGEFCHSQIECVSGTCVAIWNDEAQVTEYRCGSHTAAVDEACGVDTAEDLECRYPVRCDLQVFGDTVCQQRAGTGATCSDNSDCASGLCESLQCERACYEDPRLSLLQGE